MAKEMNLSETTKAPIIWFGVLISCSIALTLYVAKIETKADSALLKYEDLNKDRDEDHKEKEILIDRLTSIDQRLSRMEGSLGIRQYRSNR